MRLKFNPKWQLGVVGGAWSSGPSSVLFEFGFQLQLQFFFSVLVNVSFSYFFPEQFSKLKINLYGENVKHSYQLSYQYFVKLKQQS